ncbi:sugar transferase, partial [Rhizobium ruizarguesonis]
GIGAVLRKTNIYELPQLFNVLKGEMSLFGPRCHAINMRAAGKLYEELVPDYHQRHIMRKNTGPPSSSLMKSAIARKSGA